MKYCKILFISLISILLFSNICYAIDSTKGTFCEETEQIAKTTIEFADYYVDNLKIPSFPIVKDFSEDEYYYYFSIDLLCASESNIVNPNIKSEEMNSIILSKFSDISSLKFSSQHSNKYVKELGKEEYSISEENQDRSIEINDCIASRGYKHFPDRPSIISGKYFPSNVYIGNKDIFFPIEGLPVPTYSRDFEERVFYECWEFFYDLCGYYVDIEEAYDKIVMTSFTIENLSDTNIDLLISIELKILKKWIDEYRYLAYFNPCYQEKDPVYYEENQELSDNKSKLIKNDYQVYNGIHSDTVDLLYYINCEHVWDKYCYFDKDRHYMICQKCGWGGALVSHEYMYEYDGMENNLCCCGANKNVKYHYAINDDIIDKIYKAGEPCERYEYTEKIGYKLIHYNKYEKQIMDSEYSTEKTNIKEVELPHVDVVDATASNLSTSFVAVCEPIKYKLAFEKLNNLDLLVNVDKMEDQELVYDKKEKIHESTYIVPYYHFDGWTTIEKSSDVMYVDNEEISNLCVIDSEIIKLYPIYTFWSYQITLTYPCGGEMKTILLDAVHGDKIDFPSFNILPNTNNGDGWYVNGVKVENSLDVDKIVKDVGENVIIKYVVDKNAPNDGYNSDNPNDGTNIKNLSLYDVGEELKYSIDFGNGVIMEICLGEDVELPEPINGSTGWWIGDTELHTTKDLEQFILENGQIIKPSSIKESDKKKNTGGSIYKGGTGSSSRGSGGGSSSGSGSGSSSSGSTNLLSQNEADVNGGPGVLNDITLNEQNNKNVDNAIGNAQENINAKKGLFDSIIDFLFGDVKKRKEQRANEKENIEQDEINNFSESNEENIATLSDISTNSNISTKSIISTLSKIQKENIKEPDVEVKNSNENIGKAENILEIVKKYKIDKIAIAILAVSAVSLYVILKTRRVKRRKHRMQMMHKKDGNQ